MDVSKRKDHGRETTSVFLLRLYTLEKLQAYEAMNPGIPPLFPLTDLLQSILQLCYPGLTGINRNRAL